MTALPWSFLLWGIVSFAGAAIGLTPDWLGRPFGALIGVLFICTGVLLRAVYDTRSAAA